MKILLTVLFLVLVQSLYAFSFSTTQIVGKDTVTIQYSSSTDCYRQGETRHETGTLIVTSTYGSVTEKVPARDIVEDTPKKTYTEYLEQRVRVLLHRIYLKQPKKASDL